MNAKINHLVVKSKGKNKIHLRTFVAKPSPQFEEELGQIFGIIEIESSSPKAESLIDLIIDEIKNNYYQEEILHQSNIFEIDEKFEAVLKKTNLSISAYLEKANLKIDLSKINIILALIHNKNIYFTLVGKMNSDLYYKTQNNSYRIIDILEDTKTTQTQAPDPLKLFSQVISGPIRNQDILFFSTSNLFDYFSQDRIKNIITAQSSTEQITEIKNIIETLDSKENFGVIILKPITKKEQILQAQDKPSSPSRQQSIKEKIGKINYKEEASRDSMKDLIRTEDETQKLLTPSILPLVKKYTQSLKTTLSNHLNKFQGSTSCFFSMEQI